MLWKAPKQVFANFDAMTFPVTSQGGIRDLPIPVRQHGEYRQGTKVLALKSYVFSKAFWGQAMFEKQPI